MVKPTSPLSPTLTHSGLSWVCTCILLGTMLGAALLTAYAPPCHTDSECEAGR